MKRKLRELAKEPQFIEGIYNYCDNWCERCQFTTRCLSYASTAELMKEAGDTGDELSRSLETVASVFAETKEMLLEMAEERGIDLNSPEAEAAWQDEQRRNREAREEPLFRAAEAYSFQVQAWFQSQQSDEPEADEPVALPDHYEEVSEAVEIIHWYQFFIASKLFRASDPPAYDQIGDEEMRRELEAHMAEHTSGTVKIALIGMDRSLLAWQRLQHLLPEAAPQIVTFIKSLERLRRQTELAFPHARDFIRPGFDEAVDYEM
ncbi:MAG TPA: hypothetical protein VNQ79_07230 [Blastocatellia bacterium]|nr:hypothetical protein [Blastocatellia bacterium]